MNDELVDFSEYGQPAALMRYLPPTVPRLLVDIGAYDGLQGSNSRQLLLDGWRGVLVEPMPRLFELLRKNSRGLDEVHLFNCAVANRNGRAVMGYEASNETGQNASLYQRDTNTANMQVEVLTLNTLLALVHAPQQFGLLMIDTESGDLEALQGLDFARYQPAVILTESFAPKDPDKHRLLQEAGYDHRETVGSDTIWTSRALVGQATWPEQLPRLIHPVAPTAFLMPTQTDSGSVCIDEMDEGLTYIRGWAFIDAAHPVPRQLAVIIGFADGSQACFRGFRCTRTDVAEHFENPDLLLSGFKIHLPPGLKQKSVAFLRLIQTDGSICHISGELAR